MDRAYCRGLRLPPCLGLHVGTVLAVDDSRVVSGDILPGAGDRHLGAVTARCLGVAYAPLQAPHAADCRRDWPADSGGGPLLSLLVHRLFAMVVATVGRAQCSTTKLRTLMIVLALVPYWLGSSGFLSSEIEPATENVPMTYTEEFCTVLLARLERAPSLPVHLLVEYSSVIDFWLDEIRHCLNLLDEYPERIQIIRNAQRPYLQQQGRRASPFRRGLIDSRRRELRASLVKTTRSLIGRMFRDKLIPAEKIRRASLLLEIDFSEIDEGG